MKNTLKLFIMFLTLALTLSKGFAQDFPYGPQVSITPGKICDVPTAYRYAEKIAYCERDVDYETKETIIAEYDLKFGYHIKSLPREDFKIDHFIPLCMGGSNDISNLWPQHKSVYIVSDPLEPILCAKMAQGKLKQSDAVKLVIEAKTDLNNVARILKYAKRL
jgi:hypothetical protein